jgi:zinc transport system substrate-binding protein
VQGCLKMQTSCMVPPKRETRERGRSWRDRRWPGSLLTLAFMAWFLIGLILVDLSLCTSVSSKVSVVASIVPLGDFCQQVGGDLVQVQVLVPPGASEHTFEPSPSVVAKAAQARVFVYVGPGMEPWAERLLKMSEVSGRVVVEAVHGIALLEDETEGHALEGRSAGGEVHGHEGGNPHVWLHPVLAQGICRRIADAFIQVDPQHRTTYESNLQKYLKQLESLDEDFRKAVSAFRIKDFVSFHPAYSYLAKRYGLREAGVIELSPGREPTPRHIQQIVETIRKKGIRVVFAEPQLSPRVAEVIAKEARVRVLMLDPLGGRSPYGTNYVGLMKYNLSMLEEAMK